MGKLHINQWYADIFVEDNQKGNVKIEIIPEWGTRESAELSIEEATQLRDFLNEFLKQQ